MSTPTPQEVQETHSILTCLGAIAWMLSEGDTEQAARAIETMRTLCRKKVVVEALDALGKVVTGEVPYESTLVTMPLRDRILKCMVGGAAAFATYSRHLCTMVNERERLKFAIGVLEQTKTGAITPHEAYEQLGQYRGLSVDEASCVVSCAEMMKRNDGVVWTVERLIPSGSFVVVAGYAGCGKSYLVLDLCLKHASCTEYTANQWLDTFDTYGGKAVYFDLENAPYITSSRLHMLGAKGDEKLSFLTREALDLPVFDIVNRRTYDKIRRQLDLLKLTPQDIVVFDTMRACHAGDENSSEDTQKVIGSLMGCCPATKIVIHHMNKGEGSILKRLRGSTAIGGAADLILGVETTGVGDAKTTKIESGKTRGGAEIEEVNINWLERGGRLNFSVRTNYVLTDSRSVSILQTLQDEERRMTFSDIMANVKGFSGNAVMDALKNLINEGKITREIVNNKAYYTYTTTTKENQ